MAVNGSAGDRRRRRTRLLAAIAVLVPVVPIVIGIALTSGGSSARAPSAGTTYTPVSEQRTSASQLTPKPQLGSPIPPGAGALVAQIVTPSAMLSSPGGRELARAGLRTQFGSPDFVLVAKVSGSWLGVVSTLAGNNRLGWIPLSATTLSRVPYEIKVSLSARRLTVLDSGRVVQRYTIAVGRPTAPTPTGRFAVTDRLATGDPTGPYGCCILALSAVSPACDPRVERRQPDRDPLDPRYVLDRAPREPWLHAADARRGTLADVPHPARHAGGDHQLAFVVAMEFAAARVAGTAPRG